MKEKDGHVQLKEFLESLPGGDKEYATLYMGIDLIICFSTEFQYHD